MKQAGIQPDDPVEIVGHSQGGIIAAAAATDFKINTTSNISPRLAPR